jgi:hypothetical protein
MMQVASTAEQTFNELHDFISQKIEIFITTAVRFSRFLKRVATF